MKRITSILLFIILLLPFGFAETYADGLGALQRIDVQKSDEKVTILLTGDRQITYQVLGNIKEPTNELHLKLSKISFKDLPLELPVGVLGVESVRVGTYQKESDSLELVVKTKMSLCFNVMPLRKGTQLAITVERQVYDFKFREENNSVFLDFAANTDLVYSIRQETNPNRTIISFDKTNVNLKNSAYAIGANGIEQLYVQENKGTGKKDIIIESLFPMKFNVVNQDAKSDKKTLAIEFYYQLAEVKYSEEENALMISLNTTKAVTPSVKRFTNPERLVIDLPGLKLGALDSTNLAVNDKYVKQIRIGQFSYAPDIVRVVVDLEGMQNYFPVQVASPTELIFGIGKRDIVSELLNKIIVVDAGHGGTDPGARGRSGLNEKDVNLSIAKELEAILSGAGAKVVMTRPDDTFIPLPERVRICKEAKADIFVSVHINSFTNPNKSGTETYYYHKNKNDLQLAKFVQEELLKELRRADNKIRFGNFHVLRNNTVPAILAEIAYVSNPEEEILLMDNSTHKRAAKAIFAGIQRYFQAFGGGVNNDGQALQTNDSSNTDPLLFGSDGISDLSNATAKTDQNK